METELNQHMTTLKMSWLDDYILFSSTLILDKFMKQSFFLLGMLKQSRWSLPQGGL